jgi:DNA-binding CsgD family transcriptional regulator
MAGALSDHDVRGILGFLYEAGEADGPDVLTDAAVAALFQLVDVDRGGVCNVWRGLDPRADVERLTVYDFASVGAEWGLGLQSCWTDEEDEICRRLVARDEVIPPHPRFMRRPLRVSDLHSQRALRANELHCTLRPRWGGDSVWLWLPGPEKGTLRRISFCSEHYGGIGDRVVRILELLAPHFQQLFKRAAVRRNQPTAGHGLTPREVEVMSLVREGKTDQEVARILWVSPHTVGTHLEHVYEKLEVTNRTAAVARLFADSGNGGSPP